MFRVRRRLGEIVYSQIGKMIQKYKLFDVVEIYLLIFAAALILINAAIYMLKSGAFSFSMILIPTIAFIGACTIIMGLKYLKYSRRLWFK